MSLIFFFFFFSLPLHHALDPESLLNVEYNVSSHSFTRVSVLLSRQLVAYSRNPPQVLLRRFLAPRRAFFQSRPNRFIMINMVDNVPGRTATLALCDDDLYVPGFKDTTLQWNHFKRFEPIVPGSRELPFEHDYPNLLPLFPNGTKRSHIDLYQVPLGKAATLRAFRTLASYNPGTTPRPHLRSALVTLIVTFCEGHRFDQLNRRLKNEWDNPRPIYMLEEEAPYVVQWGSLSRALQWWEESGRKRWTNNKDDTREFDKIHANSPQAARDVLLFLQR
uniref:rRNA N-glycosylase n=2 Tax=Triticum urartu TaxID=4572 RepID=A0A8R7Q1M3_TRIUA